MTDLQSLQEDFKQYLFDGTGAIDKSIVETDTLDVQARLDIYRFAYTERIIEAIAGDYPVFKHFVGEDDFNTLAHVYIYERPSHSFSLNKIVHDFADFISDKTPASTDKGYLKEIAVLGQLHIKAFDAPDMTSLTEEDLAALPPENWPDLTFTLHPSVGFLSCEWNVFDLHQDISQKTGIDIKPEQRNTHDTIMVWRHGTTLNLQNRVLDKRENTALQALSTGAPFSDICDIVAQYTPSEKAEIEAASFLRTWLKETLFIHQETTHEGV